MHRKPGQTGPGDLDGKSGTGTDVMPSICFFGLLGLVVENSRPDRLWVDFKPDIEESPISTRGFYTPTTRWLDNQYHVSSRNWFTYEDYVLPMGTSSDYWLRLMFRIRTTLSWLLQRQLQRHLLSSMIANNVIVTRGKPREEPEFYKDKVDRDSIRTNDACIKAREVPTWIRVQESWGSQEKRLCRDRNKRPPAAKAFFKLQIQCRYMVDLLIWWYL